MWHYSMMTIVSLVLLHVCGQCCPAVPSSIWSLIMTQVVFPLYTTREFDIHAIKSSSKEVLLWFLVKNFKILYNLVS